MLHFKNNDSQVWRCTGEAAARDCYKFEASLGYRDRLSLKKNAPPSASSHTSTHPSSIFAFWSSLNRGPHNATGAPWLAFPLGFFCLFTSFHAACSLKLLSPSLPRPPTKTINVAGSVTPQHQGDSGWNPTWPSGLLTHFDYPSCLSQNFLPSVFSLLASPDSLTNSPAVPFSSLLWVSVHLLCPLALSFSYAVISYVVSFSFMA